MGSTEGGHLIQIQSGRDSFPEVCLISNLKERRREPRQGQEGPKEDSTQDKQRYGSHKAPKSENAAIGAPGKHILTGTLSSKD